MIEKDEEEFLNLSNNINILIHNKMKKNNSKCQKTIKVLYILIVIFLINMLFILNKYVFMPKEIINLADKSLSEKQKAQNFLDLCLKGININKKRFKKNKNPKFSLIIPVLNKRQYLTKLITSIQNQLYENIEIVFVDDYSKDGSIELIQEYMRKDKRIILIKHKQNMGTLITRNDGVLNSNGEYILFVDPDDMILEECLQN